MPDFYTLLEQKKPLWVTNHSGGKIILELKREGHKSKPYTAKIPPIKDYPFLLTKLVPLPIIEYDHSTVFEWIRKGLLKLHDPKDVEEMYTEEPEMLEAVEEMLEASNQDHRFQSKDIGLTTADGAKDRATSFTGKRNFDLDEMLGTSELTANRSGNSVTLELAAEQQKVSQKISSLIAQVAADGSTQQDVLIKLKTLDKELLTPEALGFIIDHSTNLPAINKWARSKRAELVSQRDVPKKKKRV